jgi:hypothetical protein
MAYFQVDEHGRKNVVNAGGGAANVWGCTLVMIVSDTGVFASHIWEIPSFKIPPSEAYDRADRCGWNPLTEVNHTLLQEEFWTHDVHDFFLHGGGTLRRTSDTAGLGMTPPSPALLSLTRPYKPFHKSGRNFLRAKIFTVADSTDGGLQYPDRIEDLRHELAELLDMQPTDVLVHAYNRPDHRPDPLSLDNAIAWQLATKQGRSSGPGYCLRTFWDREVEPDLEGCWTPPAENRRHCSLRAEVASRVKRSHWDSKLLVDLTAFDADGGQTYREYFEYHLPVQNDHNVSSIGMGLDGAFTVNFHREGAATNLSFGNYHIEMAKGDVEWRYGVDQEAHPTKLPRCLGGEWVNGARVSWCHFEC